ncbi:hypothetical protein GJR88_04530 [Dietzia sp. DQ12-45-1b]|nr:hypothetical protein GJR88_04530 [Dietzia sp. DQ12-45-1b]
MTIERGPLDRPPAGHAVPCDHPRLRAQLHRAGGEPRAPQHPARSRRGGADSGQLRCRSDGEGVDLPGEDPLVVGVGLAHQVGAARPGHGGLAHQDGSGLVPDQWHLAGLAPDAELGRGRTGGQVVGAGRRGGVLRDVRDLDVQVLRPHQAREQGGQAGVGAAHHHAATRSDLVERSVDVVFGGHLAAFDSRVLAEDGRDRRRAAAEDDHASIMDSPALAVEPGPR